MACRGAFPYLWRLCSYVETLEPHRRPVGLFRQGGLRASSEILVIPYDRCVFQITHEVLICVVPS